ncbi:hypothetical protein SAMN04488082_104170 [Desulfomicrobium apsheronum]|jgi:hypothetical protein|uniref:Tir chaperone protein (CesT) family protein n=1 Tax=Desulfomicrobium apsheronum TaxID=52560 RepID=A0A1I3SHZ8_9BACT|nr:hypothetical protein [Desulfomicrobium apsheronum]MDY0227747.1 hypothetical protein [Desulfomicrobium apsheronum]SFJ58334.1 hypothetical protein SAMN04488082_104170 [Desulfomicrobium apsheronum]
MDLIKFAEEMETVLKAAATESELVSPASEDGAIWGFELGEDASGFLSLESNQGTLDVPTVTVSLSLGSIEEVSKEDLMDLLIINGDLLGASLTITPPLGEEQEEFLMLQTKFVASEFSEDMFNKSVTSLMTQMSIFFEAE